MFSLPVQVTVSASCVAARALLVVLVAGPLFAQEPPLRDPTQPFQAVEQRSVGEPAARGFRLSAVLLSQTRRIAVVNGAIHREGDWIDGAQIMSIESQAVRLRRGNEDIVVRLSPRRVEAPSTEGDSAS